MADPHDEVEEGYYSGNLAHQPYPHEAVIELAKRAKALGVQFKINGIPFGAPYDLDLWVKFDGRQGASAQVASAPDAGADPAA